MDRLQQYWNREYKTLLRGFTPLVLCFIFYKLLFYPVLEDINNVNIQLNQLKSQDYSKEWFDEKIQEHVDHLNKLEFLEAKLSNSAVESDDVIYTEEKIRKLAEKHKLSINSINSQTEDVNGFEKTTIVMNMGVQYTRFDKFLKKLRTTYPLLRVEDFSLSEKKKRGMTLRKLELSFFKKKGKANG